MPTEIPDELIYDVEVAQMCEKFNKLPSEVMRENPYQMRRVWAILAELNKQT